MVQKKHSTHNILYFIDYVLLIILVKEIHYIIEK